MVSSAPVAVAVVSSAPVAVAVESTAPVGVAVVSLTMGEEGTRSGLEGGTWWGLGWEVTLFKTPRVCRVQILF